MVVTLVWMHSWIAVSISLCVLVAMLLFLVICLCWEQRNPNRLHQFYILDENGMKKAAELSLSADEDKSGGFFRRLSSKALLKPNFRFVSGRSDGCRKKGDLIEHDLLDSVDIEKQFNHAVLQIEKDCLQVDDDTLSCASNDSRHTFYSVYPRANSIAGTMRSASSHPDNLDDY